MSDIFPPGFWDFGLRNSGGTGKTQGGLLGFSQRMSETHSGASPSRRWSKIMLRIAGIVLLAYLIGSVLSEISISLHKQPSPAGFGRGIVQGALMPLALPNLLVGRDVSIYAERNDGVPYKLGYTAGVNGCGVVFFGMLFWRLKRWTRAKGARPDT